MKHKAHRSTFLALTTAILPTVAQAHVGVQAVELVAGALHPWINIESALVLAGLLLWLAQNATSTDNKPFVVHGLALAMGVAGGLFLRIPTPPWLIYSIALGSGLCVSCRLMPRPIPGLIAVGSAALLAGYYAGADAASDVKAPLVFLLGAMAGGFAIPLSIAVLLGERRSRTVQIGIRVLGSWLSAVSLMLFVLRLRG